MQFPLCKATEKNWWLPHIAQAKQMRKTMAGIVGQNNMQKYMKSSRVCSIKYCYDLHVTLPRTLSYWRYRCLVDSSWNVMAHGDAREGKWRGNWRMEWVASILHTTSERGVSSIITADVHTSAASNRLNWRPPADLNGLVHFAERRNLVSARVPSHFKRSLQLHCTTWS